MSIHSRITGLLVACVIGVFFLSSPSAAEGICVSGQKVEICDQLVECVDGMDIEACSVPGEEECYELTCGEDKITVCCGHT